MRKMAVVLLLAMALAIAASARPARAEGIFEILFGGKTEIHFPEMTICPDNQPGTEEVKVKLWVTTSLAKDPGMNVEVRLGINEDPNPDDGKDESEARLIYFRHFDAGEPAYCEFVVHARDYWAIRASQQGFWPKWRFTVPTEITRLERFSGYGMGSVQEIRERRLTEVSVDACGYKPGEYNLLRIAVYPDKSRVKPNFRMLGMKAPSADQLGLASMPMPQPAATHSTDVSAQTMENLSAPGAQPTDDPPATQSVGDPGHVKVSRHAGPRPLVNVKFVDHSGQVVPDVAFDMAFRAPAEDSVSRRTPTGYWHQYLGFPAGSTNISITVSSPDGRFAPVHDWISVEDCVLDIEITVSEAK